MPKSKKRRDDLAAALPQKEGVADIKSKTAADEDTGEKVEKPLSLERLKKIERDRSKPGICYLPYIPATLRPHRLKQILSSFGEITKVFLKPEDPEERKRRRRENNATEKGKRFTEGWIEFARKNDAKRAALVLNGQPMGETSAGKGSLKRRSRLYYELWSIKYLSKHKWSDLTEEKRYENAIKRDKLAAEIAQGKRERDWYLQHVSIAQSVERKEKAGTATAEKKPFRTFRQKDVLAEEAISESNELSEDVLKSIFSSSK